MRFLAFIMLVCWPLAAQAQTKQDPQAVAKAVQQAAQNLAPPGASVSLGPVKGAAYMPACTVPLTVTLSGTAPYEQAAAQCTSPQWTLYVTVTLAQSEAVVVAAKPVNAGQTITAADLMVKQLPVQSFAGRQVFSNPTQIEGASALMSLGTGMIITQNDVQSPLVVKAGQLVTVHVYSGGVELSLDAVADQPGHVGDTILLTNHSSGRRFSAQVTATGVVVRLD
ncbi:flagellar basal body P-ring formation chaperone FlgA [Acidocella aminolytica]|jgi:flagella basal body P-ring formation protein FlgA|uniref:Flagella basal body P-ring formation protein FlgA n=2 Tax=Acidocella TaxID=50709 RepID=A0A0D6PFS0_9PROT|nr:flagellar basal body P-ring formation chaperone FlgA [Acidocella aminolytica]GAN80063.1 flagellar basal body P-ring biosynthesis protein FlgA [Acidocella aminolytica 101 = DSM 11237]GBQ40670.1 flagellar basal body P-ring biosynthesis protein FlgA [Acidocella aminolytica 101 = DSM 11237]SHF07557.1 Chaperone for flagella basal body P-ring formation [Acidocella aminolytica 101 = DSM 11237]